MSNGRPTPNTYPLAISTLLLLLLSTSAFVVTRDRHPLLLPTTVLHLSSTPPPPTTPLCDLQTFLRMTDQVQSGGDAKTKIQSGLCRLNAQIETRRAKKLFPGDVVSLTTDGGRAGEELDVATEVRKRGYVYRVKEKKVRPAARIVDGEKEFGGRFRTDEWRKERKEKKEGRKMRNKRELLE